MEYTETVTEFIKDKNFYILQYNKNIEKYITPIHPVCNKIKIGNIYLQPFIILNHLCYGLYDIYGTGTLSLNGWCGNIDNINFYREYFPYDEDDYFLFFDLSVKDIARLKLL